jgi:hypothetical protein
LLLLIIKRCWCLIVEDVVEDAIMFVLQIFINPWEWWDGSNERVRKDILTRYSVLFRTCVYSCSFFEQSTTFFILRVLIISIMIITFYFLSSSLPFCLIFV